MQRRILPLRHFFYRLDWDQDIMPHLRFLASHSGLDHGGLAKYLTTNPWILEQNLDDLQMRVNYLESKKFSQAAIARIIIAAK